MLSILNPKHMPFSSQFIQNLSSPLISPVWLIEIESVINPAYRVNVNTSGLNIVLNGKIWFGAYLLSHTSHSTGQAGQSGNSSIELQLADAPVPTPSGLTAYSPLSYNSETFESRMYAGARVRKHLCFPDAIASNTLDGTNSFDIHGFAGDVKITGDSILTIDFRGLAEALQTKSGEVLTRFCSNDLGDARCKVDLASFTQVGVVTAVQATQETFEMDLFPGNGRDAAYWLLGRLKFSNASDRPDAGFPYIVTGITQLSATTYSVRLETIPIGLVRIGDAFTIEAGCFKDTPTCKNKFNNLNNMNAFPKLPGRLNLYARIV